MSKQDVYPVTEMRKAILNCYELPMDTDLMEAFPILKSLPFWDYKFGVFGKKADEIKNSFIRYVVYMYSPDLNCIEDTHPDEWEKRVACAELAGFKVDKDGNFDPAVETLLRNRNQYCAQMILSFIRRYHSDDWATYKYLRDQHFENMWNNDKIKDGGEQNKVLDNLEKMDKLRKKMLKGDTTKALNISLIQRVEAENLKLSPESIARNIEENLSPLGFSLTG